MFIINIYIQFKWSADMITYSLVVRCLLLVACFLMLSIVPPFHDELGFSYLLTDEASVHSASMCNVIF